MQPTPTPGAERADTEATAAILVPPAGLLPGQRQPAEQTSATQASAVTEATTEIPIIIPREAPVPPLASELIDISAPMAPATPAPYAPSLPDTEAVAEPETETEVTLASQAEETVAEETEAAGTEAMAETEAEEAVAAAETGEAETAGEPQPEAGADPQTATEPDAEAAAEVTPEVDAEAPTDVVPEPDAEAEDAVIAAAEATAAELAAVPVAEVPPAVEGDWTPPSGAPAAPAALAVLGEGEAHSGELEEARQLKPGDLAERQIAVWSEEAAQRFREDWQQIKASFVDDPVAAVSQAQALVASAVHVLGERLLAEQVNLDPRRQSDTPDTEALRVAMRQYRDFLDRVLAL